ncbi:hypothetical protein PSACC_01173 [Paramicrosporidium saccamoebae]|uniref:Uncharacterized protein n=1 Tax=Paramicrosporidium saccamoebae TaxID=1246581 RepID=A0A2H9TMR2_9FUNG|nr:hypothetical protein PSACC_01173 [Paramicrosporidium saccamoebae]
MHLVVAICILSAVWIRDTAASVPSRSAKSHHSGLAAEAAKKGKVQKTLGYPFKVLDASLEMSHSRGKVAARFFLKLLEQQRWYEASLAYRVADWNLIWEKLKPYKEKADVHLDKHPKIDFSVLGFGWRTEYRILRHNYYVKREKIIQKLRSGANMELKEILKSIHDPSLTDPRPDCVKLWDAGEVLAEAGLFRLAVTSMVDACGKSMELKHFAVLLGGFSVGLEDSLTPKNKDEALYALGLITQLFGKEYQASSALPVALSSFREALKRVLSDKRPKPHPIEKAISKFPYYRNGDDIDRALAEEASEILWQSRSEFVHYLPLIEDMYKSQYQKGGFAFYMTGAIESYNYIDSVKGQNAFVQLEADLKKWKGSPSFTPLTTKHYGPTIQLDAPTARSEGKAYTWARKRDPKEKVRKHTDENEWRTREKRELQVLPFPSPKNRQSQKFSNLKNMFGG